MIGRSGGFPGGARARHSRTSFMRRIPPSLSLAPPASEHWTPGAFAATCVFVGLGPVGATILRQVLAAGCARYVLVDGEEFGRNAIGEECGPDEVGAWRVDAIGVRLERRGAVVVGKAHSLEELAPPPAGPCLIVVGSEEPMLVRSAHRFAHVHRLPLFRVAIRPLRREFGLVVRRADRALDREVGCPDCDAAFSPFAGSGTSAPCPPLESAAAGWISLAIEASLRGESESLGDGDVRVVAPGSGRITQRSLPACRCARVEIESGSLRNSGGR